MEQNQNRIAPEAATDEPASPVNLGDSYFSPPAEQDDAPPCGKVTVPLTPEPPLVTDFDPVPLRHREDGLTPQRQREYVEALADCGVARQAAQRIGLSEQAVARVRRRADARAFDLACEAAQRIGARRLRSIAWERAIEGTIRRHYYHGELKSEEVVYDNRLLIYLLGKTAHLAEPPPETQAVVDDWQPWMEAIEQGLPAPAKAAPDPDPAPEADEEEGLADHISLWEQNDRWWTAFPPPAGFEGEEIGAFGDRDYCRTLNESEQEVVDEWEACEREERLAAGIAGRDRFFGFAGGSRDGAAPEARCARRRRFRRPGKLKLMKLPGRPAVRARPKRRTRKKARQTLAGANPRSRRCDDGAA